MALIDIPYVKTGSLGLSANDPALDSQIALWIAEAESRIVWETNQNIEQTTVTNMTFSGNGGDTKTIGYFPVSAVSSLQYKTGVGSAATWTTVSTTDYDFVADESFYLYYPAKFQKGHGNYRMTFTYGYAANAIPTDIKQVAREMVTKALLNYPGAGGHGDFGKSSTSQSFQGGSLNTVLKDLEPAWIRILEGYTRLNVA